MKSLPKYLLDGILGTKYRVILTSRKGMPNELIVLVVFSYKCKIRAIVTFFPIVHLVT